MFPVYLKEPGFSEPDDPIYYLVAKEGLFQVKQTPLFRAQRRVEGLGWLESAEEGIQLKLPLIPASLLADALGFFKQVFRKYRAEAVLLLYWRGATGQYETRIPRQQVTGSHCRYEIGPTPAGCLRVGTIHSHGGADAFHSEVDDQDEEHDDGLHVTIGTLHAKPTVACSLVVDRRRYTLRPELLLEVMPWELTPTIRMEDLDDSLVAPPQRGPGDGPGPVTYQRGLVIEE